MTAIAGSVTSPDTSRSAKSIPISPKFSIFAARAMISGTVRTFSHTLIRNFSSSVIVLSISNVRAANSPNIISNSKIATFFSLCLRTNLLANLMSQEVLPTPGCPATLISPTGGMPPKCLSTGFQPVEMNGVTRGSIIERGTMSSLKLPLIAVPISISLM